MASIELILSTGNNFPFILATNFLIEITVNLKAQTIGYMISPMKGLN